MNLPIDIISPPNTAPPKFKWRQIVDTPIGKRTIEHEGLLPPSVEKAVEALIMIAKQLDKEVVALTIGNAFTRKPIPVAVTSTKKDKV